jgi:beta-mannosidase
MQGYPNMRTVNEWDDDKAQLFPQSRVSFNHNKAACGLIQVKGLSLS